MGPADPKKGCVDYDQGGYSPSPSGQNGIFVSGQCHDPRVDPSTKHLGKYTYCNSGIIWQTTANPGDNYYYLYFTAQYAPLKVYIQGTDSHNNAVQFVGGQSVIDVTGQSADQIQRVRATVGYTPQFNMPNYAVQSMESLCKAFVLQITGPGAYTPAQTPGASKDTTGCVLPASGSIQGGGTPGH